MAINTGKNTFDFSTLGRLEKKEDKCEENVNALFEENDMYRKRLPKGPNSLLRSISEAVFFVPHHSEEIQQSLLKLLTQLIANNRLTTRLASFQGNSSMLKDYANNPRLAGFEKTTLELVSLFFQVKVILYTVNEDHYLTATIFNHNFPKTIELFRTKSNQYDPIFPKSFIQKAGVCQNIVLNLIDRVVNGVKSKQLKNLNNEEYFNISYETAQTAAASPKDHFNVDQFRITRGAHKKSLSDNFNTNFELMEEQQMKFFDAFMSAAAPNDDFLNKIRKDTTESGFSINANFDFIDEQNLDFPPAQGFAIKNYPISSSGLSPRGTGRDLDRSPMPSFTKTKFSDHPHVHFNENLSLAEIERLEKSVHTASTFDSKRMASPFYQNGGMPGMSPSKYSQRSFTDTIQTPTSEYSPGLGHEGISPFHYGNSPHKNAYMQNYQTPEQQLLFQQSLNPQRQFSDPSGNQNFIPQQNGQPFNLQSHQYSNLYMKRAGTNGNSYQQNHGDDFNNNNNHNGQRMGFEPNMRGGFNQPPPMIYDHQDGGYDQGNEFNMFNQQGGFDGAPREKKKPIILDEGQERYFGRLKFFDESKKYGFIIMDDDNSDIFVHYDDLCKAGIPKDVLRSARQGASIRLTFACMAYIGKYNKSRKAVDIQLL